MFLVFGLLVDAMFSLNTVENKSGSRRASLPMYWIYTKSTSCMSSELLWAILSQPDVHTESSGHWVGWDGEGSSRLSPHSGASSVWSSGRRLHIARIDFPPCFSLFGRGDKFVLLNSNWVSVKNFQFFKSSFEVESWNCNDKLTTRNYNPEHLLCCSDIRDTMNPESLSPKTFSHSWLLHSSLFQTWSAPSPFFYFLRIKLLFWARRLMVGTCTLGSLSPQRSSTSQTSWTTLITETRRSEEPQPSSVGPSSTPSSAGLASK